MASKTCIYMEFQGHNQRLFHHLKERCAKVPRQPIIFSWSIPDYYTNWSNCCSEYIQDETEYFRWLRWTFYVCLNFTEWCYQLFTFSFYWKLLFIENFSLLKTSLYWNFSLLKTSFNLLKTSRYWKLLIIEMLLFIENFSLSKTSFNENFFQLIENFSLLKSSYYWNASLYWKLLFIETSLYWELLSTYWILLSIYWKLLVIDSFYEHLRSNRRTSVRALTR